MSSDTLSLASCAQATLFGVALLNGLTVLSSYDEEDVTCKARVSNAISMVVCLVSAIHYTHILSVGVCSTSYRSILYSDWLVTVPLLLVEFWLLLGLPTTTPLSSMLLLVVVVMSVGMIITGYRRMYAVSWACLVGMYTLYVLSGIAAQNTGLDCNDHDADGTPAREYPASLVIFFFGMWLIYGAVELLDLTHMNRVRGFALLDVVCKAIFGFTIAWFV